MDAPQIAPEIRGMLEEIVADPRSAIRLAPERALLPWLDATTLPAPTEISSTNAERHLIEVEREALAQLLYESARIAYWKAPSLPSHLPVRGDGEPSSPLEDEPALQRRSQRRGERSKERTWVNLLDRCITGVTPADAYPLLQASLTLVPRDEARIYLGLALAGDRPRTALAILRRSSKSSATPDLRANALRNTGSCLYRLGAFAAARRAYQESSKLVEASPYPWFCLFNLACILEDPPAASHAARELLQRAPDRTRLFDESRILMTAAAGRLDDATRKKARHTFDQVKAGIPQPLRSVWRVYEAD